MFNSKSDIRNSEWIDLVFEKRNKEYGAYELRKHAADNMNRALAIMLFALSLAVGVAIWMNPKPASVVVNKSIEYTSRFIHFMPVSSGIKPQPQNIRQPVQAPKDVTHSVASHPSATPEPNNVAAVNATTATEQHTAIVANTPTATIDNTPIINNAVVIDNEELDVKPRFLGGAQEWSRFLEMNLRYPADARQNKISGIVWISFIVERNGSLSNIVIDRPAGHGFDEEAIRVLKQSPVWTPGQQNGQAVRVKYSLPINFHMVR